MKKSLVMVSLALMASALMAADDLSPVAGVTAGRIERLVPQTGISKAFLLRTSGELEMTVRFYRPDVFRVEAAPKIWNEKVDAKDVLQIITNKVDRKTGALLSAETNVVKVATTNRTYKVDYSDPENKPGKAQILADGAAEDATQVRFADLADRVVFSTSAITVSFAKKDATMTVVDFRGGPILREAKPLVVSTNGTVQTLASSPESFYYGGGQQVGFFSHKGKRIKIEADGDWCEGGHPNPAPWFMSSDGYGVLRHTFSTGVYDFTSNDAVALSHDENRFDAFYFCGGGFAAVLDRYTELTGRPNFIPMWGLELGDADAYMTRDAKTKDPSVNTNDGSFVETTPDVIARVAEPYRLNDMPGGWLLVNDGYGCGHMELGHVVKALAELGFHTGLWTEGALDRIRWEVGTAGTRVQKLDVAWTGPAYQHGLNCCRDAFVGIVSNSDARAFIWTVQGWAGTQRYGVCWAGDEYGSWDLIRYMIPTITGSGMSGQAYATTDVDGIFGGSNETYLRDLQWKCWTTAMYCMNGWSHMNKSPWSYPEPYRSLCREALKRKLRLTPYIYAAMREAYDTGAPIVRPMVWNYPDDTNTWGAATAYQFMLGRDVLVAPVYTSMDVNKGWWRKGIHLPAGEWYDYNDGRRIAGPTNITAYPVTLAKLPVFVRAGAILPMYPAALYSAQVPKTTLTFDVYPRPSVGESFRLYEDDGSTRAYEKGEFSRQVVGVFNQATAFDRAGDLTVMVHPAHGSFKGMEKERVYEFDIHTQAKPLAVFVKSCEGYPARTLADGQEVLALPATNGVETLYRNCVQGWYYDPAEKFGTLHVKLARGATSRTVLVEVRMPAADVARMATPAYPVPSAAEEAAAHEAVSRDVGLFLKEKFKAADLAKLGREQEGKLEIDSGLRYRRIMVAKDRKERGVTVRAGRQFTLGPLDGTWKRLEGNVAIEDGTSPDARVTFRVFANGKKIFERAGMKGTDVKQLLAVDIPRETQWLRFTFEADDDAAASKEATGVWLGAKLVGE